MDGGSTSLKLVTAPYDPCRIDGQWKRFVESHNVYERVRMRLGAPVVGDNEMLYVEVYSSSVWRGLSLAFCGIT